MKKDQMSSKERVHATVRGLPVDRVPVFYWLNAHMGAKLMSRYKGSSSRAVNGLARFVWNRFEKGGEQKAKELWRFLPLLFDLHSCNYANTYGMDRGADLVLASFATPWRYAKFYLEDGHIRARDIYGVVRGLGGGIYPDMIEPVIKDVSDLASYELPDPDNDKLYRTFHRYRKKYPQASILAETWGPQDFTATSMFGMERFMLELYDHPEEMKTFLHRWTDFNIAVAVNSVKAGADIVFILDDYGYNNRPLISMKMWQEFIKPELKRMVDAAHEAGALAALHSCGFQMPFVEHYVELGIDMLQAFQPMAGNDFAKAYGEYGDRITFITGIDIQQGEFMTPDEFRADILKSYEIGGKKGRHVLGTSHEVQYTMPLENMAAMFDTVAQIQAGLHDG